MIADHLLSKQNLLSIFRICTRGFMKMAIRGCNIIDFWQATRSRCNYPPAAPLAAKTFFSFTKRLPSEILEKKNAMYQSIAQPILSQVLYLTYYNFSYLKHPNAVYGHVLYLSPYSFCFFLLNLAEGYLYLLIPLTIFFKILTTNWPFRSLWIDL